MPRDGLEPHEGDARAQIGLEGRDDHVRFAKQHIDLGVTHLYFHCAGPGQFAFLEGYGRDVLPGLMSAEWPAQFRNPSCTRA